MADFFCFLTEFTELIMAVGKSVSFLVHAFVGWALCAATMGIGMALTSTQTALIIHAAGAPLIYVFVSRSYFRRPGCLSPLIAAAAFVGFVVAVDFFVVALIVFRNREMFGSLLGTWIPFALIFVSTWVTGRQIRRNQPFNV